MTMQSGFLFVISAPSGAGKSTIIKELLLKDASLDLSVSYTTRKPRIGEINGKDYCFITKNLFCKMVVFDEFVEYAEVFGNYYGTTKKSLQHRMDQNLHTLLDIDWQGAKNIKDSFPLHTKSIFILPPSLEVLEDRLRNRKTDDEETILRRLAQAKSDIEWSKMYDYCVENNVLDDTVEEVYKIIQNYSKPFNSR